MTSSSKRVDWAWGEIVFYFDGQKFYEINTNVNFQSRAPNNTVLLLVIIHHDHSDWTKMTL